MAKLPPQLEQFLKSQFPLVLSIFKFLTNQKGAQEGKPQELTDAPAVEEPQKSSVSLPSQPSLVRKLQVLLHDQLSLLSKPQTHVGISVGSSSIKVIELKKMGKLWKLIHFGMIQLPEDAVVNREIVNPVAVTENIKVLMNQVKLLNKNVCTSLSGTSLIVKRMTVTSKNDKDLQDQVFWEAEQYLPFDVSEVVMDYQVLSKLNEKEVDVIFVAVKKSVLDSYMNCISDAGLKPKIVDLDFFALQNLVEANYPVSTSEAIAAVDLGASAMKVVIMSGGVPVYTKDAVMGGRNLTAEIQKNLNLSFLDAEALKISGGASGVVPQEVSELMQNMAENLAMEIKKTIEFYRASSVGPPVSSVLLTGGTAGLPGFSKMVEETVSLPCQLINPFNAISYDPSVFTPDYLNSIAPLASIPIGLALRAGSS